MAFQPMLPTENIVVGSHQCRPVHQGGGDDEPVDGILWQPGQVERTDADRTPEIEFYDAV